MQITVGRKHWSDGIGFRDPRPPNAGNSDCLQSRDGRYLCSCSDDKTIIIWDVEAEQAVSQLHGHEHWVFSLSMHPHGNSLVSGDYKGEIKIWDFKTGKCVVPITNAHVEPVTCVEFNKEDSSIIASGSYDGTCRILRDHRLDKTLYDKQRPPVSFVKFSPNGLYVLVSSLDGKLRLYNYKAEQNKRVVKEYKGHRNNEYCIASKFSITRGKYVVSGSEDNLIYLWDVQKSRNIVQKLAGHRDVVLAVDCHPVHSIIASGSTGAINKDMTVRLWEDSRPR